MIDWDRVRELRDEIGDDGFDEVVNLFLEETDEVANGLDKAKGAKAMESGLHFLKGSSLNLGFCDLAALCQEGERRAAAGDVETDLDKVRAIYRASKAALVAGLSDLAA